MNPYAGLESVASSTSLRTTFTEPRVCSDPNCLFPFGPACQECGDAFDQHEERREERASANRAWKWIDETDVDGGQKGGKFTPTGKDVARLSVYGGTTLRHEVSSRTLRRSNSSLISRTSRRKILESPGDSEPTFTRGGNKDLHKGFSEPRESISTFPKETVIPSTQHQLPDEVIKSKQSLISPARSRRDLSTSCNSEIAIDPDHDLSGSTDVLKIVNLLSERHPTEKNCDEKVGPPLQKIGDPKIRNDLGRDHDSERYSRRFLVELCPYCSRPVGDPTEQHVLKCKYAHEERRREEETRTGER